MRQRPECHRAISLRHTTVAIDVAAKVGLERFEQPELNALEFADFAFQVSHTFVKRIVAFLLVRNLALLNQVPE
jgi:hypothetical protein